MLASAANFFWAEITDSNITFCVIFIYDIFLE